MDRFESVYSSRPAGNTAQEGYGTSHDIDTTIWSTDEIENDSGAEGK